jgi:hypothetical protein
VKVLIGIPNLNDRDRYHGYLGSTLKHVEAAIGDVEHEVFVTPPTHLASWEGLVDRQNLILQRFLSGDWGYLWHVELDVQVPKDAFEKLYALDVDVACGYVQRHSGDGLICGFMDEQMKVWYLPLKTVRGNILTGWVMAGTSCVLFKRRVFEEGLRFRYMPNVTPDILFMFDVQRLGYIAKVHGDVLCGHLPEHPLSSLEGEGFDE